MGLVRRRSKVKLEFGGLLLRKENGFVSVVSM
jgi:hypothetical protein